MKTVMIDGKEFVEKGNVEEVIIQEKDFIGSHMIGQFVIVRSRNEGVNAGTLQACDETGVILSNARRLHYHAPKDKKLSWYEGVAQSGVSDSSRVSCTTEKKIIVEDCSITECTSLAEKSIMEKTPNEQS